MSNHISWHNKNLNINNFCKEFETRVFNIKKSKYADEFQGNIPIYYKDSINSMNTDLGNEIYNNFFNDVGVLIVRNAYDNNVIDRYDKWSKLELEKAKNDKNFRHPKQSGKFLINDIIGRMGISDPELLMEIINNKILTKSKHYRNV